MITYPEWYKGGFPDVEEDILAPFFASLTSAQVLTWLPPQNVYEQVLADGGGYLRIYRVGGPYNPEQNRDEPNVQIAALTAARDESWKLIGFCREMLALFMKAAAIVPGTPHLLGCAGELVGPQLIPEQLRDDRLVPVTFSLYTWRPGGLGNYRQALGL